MKASNAIAGVAISGIAAWLVLNGPNEPGPDFGAIDRAQADALASEIKDAGFHCPAVNHGRLEVDHYGKYLVLDCGPASDRALFNGVSYKRYVDASRPVAPVN